MAVAGIRDIPPPTMRHHAMIEIDLGRLFISSFRSFFVKGIR